MCKPPSRARLDCLTQSGHLGRSWHRSASRHMDLGHRYRSQRFMKRIDRLADSGRPFRPATLYSLLDSQSGRALLKTILTSVLLLPNCPYLIAASFGDPRSCTKSLRVRLFILRASKAPRHDSPAIHATLMLAFANFEAERLNKEKGKMPFDDTTADDPSFCIMKSICMLALHIRNPALQDCVGHTSVDDPLESLPNQPICRLVRRL